MRKNRQNSNIPQIFLLVLLIVIYLSACGKETDTDSAEIYDFDEPGQQDEASDVKSELLEETEPMKYPMETVYTDEEHNLITYGSINYNTSYFHVIRIVEEENRTTFVTKMDADFIETKSSDAPIERTYIFSKEPNLVIDSYQEAMQFFAQISEYQTFRSYIEDEEDGFQSFYMAINGEKTYYLIALTGEEGFYFIETENNSSMDRSLMWNDSEYREYEYDLSQVECGQDYTAQIEMQIYYQDQRAEYQVTSDLLSYTGELQIVPSEDKEYDLIREMNITNIEKGEQWDVSSTRWPGDYENADDYPQFINVNGDGYLDFRICVGHGTRNTWYIVFVWDIESGKYIQLEEDGAAKGKDDYLTNRFDDPFFQDGYLKQVFGDSTRQVYQLFRVEGNKLIMIEEDISVYDEELGDWVDQKEE